MHVYYATLNFGLKNRTKAHYCLYTRAFRYRNLLMANFVKANCPSNSQFYGAAGKCQIDFVSSQWMTTFKLDLCLL